MKDNKNGQNGQGDRTNQKTGEHTQEKTKTSTENKGKDLRGDDTERKPSEIKTPYAGEKRNSQNSETIPNGTKGEFVKNGKENGTDSKRNNLNNEGGLKSDLNRTDREQAPGAKKNTNTEKNKTSIVDREDTEDDMSDEDEGSNTYRTPVSEKENDLVDGE